MAKFRWIILFKNTRRVARAKRADFGVRQSGVLVFSVVIVHFEVLLVTPESECVYQIFAEKGFSEGEDLVVLLGAHK